MVSDNCNQRRLQTLLDCGENQRNWQFAKHIDIKKENPNATNYKL